VRKRTAKKVDAKQGDAPAEPVKRAARAPKAATAAQPDAPSKPVKKAAGKRVAKPKAKEGSAG